MYDLRDFITAVGDIVASHRLAEPGAYRRWNWQDTRSTRDLSLNPYGCADAANILYTAGSFPQDPQEPPQPHYKSPVRVHQARSTRTPEFSGSNSA